jgi:hypothetical protein
MRFKSSISVLLDVESKLWERALPLDWQIGAHFSLIVSCAKCWAQNWCMALALFHGAQRSISSACLRLALRLVCDALFSSSTQAHLVCPAVPRGMIYTCELRAPCPSAAKRIMAMNKSAVAIDHPVILSDMQSANVTPLFINRAARVRSFARIQDIREWGCAARKSYFCGGWNRLIYGSGVCLLWLAGLAWHARPSRRCVLNNLLSADTWREKWPIAQIDSLLLSIWTGQFMDF